MRPTTIAQLKTTRQQTAPFILQSSIALSDPTLLDKQWEINGRVVQRKVVSRTYDGKPAVVIIWCPVNPQSSNFILQTTELPELGPLVPAAAPQATVTFIVGGRPFVCRYYPRGAKKLKEGPHAVTYKSFSQLVNGPDKILGAHFYVTHYSNGAKEIAVRISNATLDGPSGAGFCGQVFYEDAFITIDGVRNNLVKAPGNHVIFPMQQTHRRYEFGHQPQFCRSVFRNGFHEVGAYGAEMQKLPKYTADFTYNGQSGWGAIGAKQWNSYQALKTAFDSGNENTDHDVNTDRLGLFHPYYLGDSGSGAPGGWGIHPCAGLGQSQTNVELLKLQHKGMMDRHSVVCFDKDGEYIDTHSFAAAHNGVQPFYHNIIGGWKPDWDGGAHEQVDAPPYFRADMGKPWNTGTCSYIGAKYQGGLRDYEYIDDAHYSRVTKFAKGLAYLCGDELAIEDHRNMTDFCLFSWGITSHTLSWEGQGDHSVLKQLEIHRQNPHHGGWLSRAFGWVLHSMCDAYVLAPDSWRTKNRPWFTAVEELFEISAMPSGIWQREGYIGGAYDSGQIPTNQDLAGAIYIGIVSAGVLGLVRGVLGNSPILGDIMNRLIASLYDNGPYAPHGQAYWVSVATKGQPPHAVPQHFAGGLESYNGYWTLMAGYYAANNTNHLERIKNYADPSPTHNERIKKLFQNASSWDDKIENAAYYIGEIQSWTN